MNADLRKMYENYKKINRLYNSYPKNDADQAKMTAKVDILFNEIEELKSKMDFTMRLHRWGKTGAYAELLRVRHFDVGWDEQGWVTVRVDRVDGFKPQINWSAMGNQDLFITTDFIAMLEFAKSLAYVMQHDLQKEYKVKGDLNA